MRFASISIVLLVGSCDLQHTAELTTSDAPAPQAGSPNCPSTESGPAESAGPVILAANQRPVAIAANGTQVCWLNYDGTAVSGSYLLRCIAPCSGSAPWVVASLPDAAGVLALDSTNAYWTEGSGPTRTDNLDCAIGAMPISGGQPQTLVTGLECPNTLAVDASSVYWASGYGVGKVGLQGGAPTLLGTGWYPFGIAVGPSDVYWSDMDRGDIVKAGLGGGDPTTLASTPLTVGGVSLTSALSIAADQTNAYWITQGIDAPFAGAVMKVPLAGGAPVTLASGSFSPWGIAVDSTSVYWTEQMPDGTSSIMKVGLDGGQPVVLASRSGVPLALAMDATSLYWAEEGPSENAAADGAIVQLKLR